MSEEHGEYKFTREQQRHLNKNRDAKLAYRDGDKGAKAAKEKDWRPFNIHKPDTGAGKGDDPRQRNISHDEYGLRYDLAIGKISMEEFEAGMKELRNEQD
tara:strand:- start:167 stop:466 length:300 start_codon:yes stop_codon:yes gene_type:complete